MNKNKRVKIASYDLGNKSKLSLIVFYTKELTKKQKNKIQEILNVCLKIK